MTSIRSKQRRSVIIDLTKKCEVFYEKHPGAFQNAEKSRWLADAELKLSEDLDAARTMIEMRKAANDFLKRFMDVCKASKAEQG